MAEEKFIPQIKMETGESIPTKADTGKEAQGSILVPKLGEKSGRQVSEKSKIGFFRHPKRKKILTAVGIFLLIFLISILIPSVFVYRNTKAFIDSANGVRDAIETQDIALIKESLTEVKVSHTSLKNSYRFVSWTRFIPFFGSYTRDFGHLLNAVEHGLEAGKIVIVTIEPYADIIGFSGDSVMGVSDDAEKTTQDRIDFIIQTLPQLTAQMDEISEEVEKVRNELNQINPSRYPVRVGEREVRANLKRGIELVDEFANYVSQGRPLLETAPYILGLDESRTYFVLFQNDKELRPTGGFMTAYSIMNVDKAKFEPVSSDDIYNLDARYRPRIPAPDPLVRYIRGPYILSKNIRLRDMNWSPDFKVSMDAFTQEIANAGIRNIDGIIAVDTYMVVNLLDVIGPIDVPGFGRFSNEIIPQCNCPQVIYELESFADIEGPIVWDPITGEIIHSPPNIDNRKKIIGPMMNTIMAHALGQPKEKMPALFEAAFKSLMEKHVLFYFFDDEAQAAVETFGIAGTLSDYDGDYLHINDANLGGRKSNMYVTQGVEQEIIINRDGSVEKTVTITYRNPEDHDGWLNSVLPNWVRIYVPKGSTLLSFEGVEDEEEPYEELGKTVFAGHFSLRPQGVAKVTVKYRLPFTVNDDYRLLIQKQPGTDAPLHHLIIGRQEEEFFLRTDKQILLNL